MYRIRKEASFSAAHHLRHYQGKCERLHGHNWRVEAVAQGHELDEGGMLLDFGDLKKALNEVLAPFDHADLNTVPPFDTIETSAENLARIILEALAAKLDSERVRIVEVTVWETPTSAATYIRND